MLTITGWNETRAFVIIVDDLDILQQTVEKEKMTKEIETEIQTIKKEVLTIGKNIQEMIEIETIQEIEVEIIQEMIGTETIREMTEAEKGKIIIQDLRVETTLDLVETEANQEKDLEVEKETTKELLLHTLNK